MKKILFVCHGNICRSPMAEMVMKHLVAEQGLKAEYEIDSVATSTEEIGNDIYPPAKQCLRQHGIAFTRRAARQMTRHDYHYYDEIYVMDDNNLRYLHRLFPDIVEELSRGCYYDPSGKIQLLMSLTGISRDVADPWYTGDFEATYRDVVAGCREILKH